MHIIAKGCTVYQWDTGRYVTIDENEPGDLIDFAGAGDCNALSVAVDGDGDAPIPNELLKDGRDICAWVRRGGKTICSGVIAVKRRKKPLDYVYTETPTVGYQQLKKEVDELREQVGQGGGGTVQEVEPPLVLTGHKLTVDLSGVRGTQVTQGDAAPTSSANRGDSYIRTNGELWEFTDVPGTY